MLTPSTHATVRPFYAFGNTPAVSLTESLPQGVNADVLLLGCGDVRHILYTCYAEKGLPKRKLDVTACDIEPMIIARNILLLSLIVEGPPGKQAVSSEQIWRIYYHLYLDSQDSELLLKQTEKLFSVSASLAKWNDSVYGTVIRFADDNTFSLIRDIWRRWSAAASAKDDPQYKAQFESDRKASNEFKKKAWGESMFSYTGAKAAAPMSSAMYGKLLEASETYWKTGLADPRMSASGLYPNPLFALAISAIKPLAFADPALSFHLAPAQAKLTELSPLRLAKDIPEKAKIFETAQLLFKEWTTAFKQAASESRAVVRFTLADRYSLCQTLQYHNSSGISSGNWYQRELGLQVLTLAETEYQGSEKAPTKFDVIDTSNISDYNGALTLLVSTGPLLKDKPWSTLYTELMSRDGETDAKGKFESLLCEHTTTIALILGLTPIEYWTNATAMSVMDVAMATMMDAPVRGGVKLQVRVAWKLGSYLPESFPGEEKSTPRILRMDAEDVANHAFHVYSEMFKHEKISTLAGLTIASAGKDSMAENPFPKYHRGTFVAYLKAVCQSVQTDAGEVGHLLLSKVQADTSSMLGSNHLQALSFELFSSGVYTDPSLVSTIQLGNTQAPFCKWKQIPPAVAVTIVVPAARWQPVYRIARGDGMTLVLEGNVKCGGANAYHNIFSNVQIAFGTLTAVGSRQDDDFKLTIEEDQDGWLGSSALIASFNVNTAGLQIDIPSTNVSLGIQQSVQAITSFGKALGMHLSIFETRLLDEGNLYVTKHSPRQPGYYVVCGSQSVSQPKLDASATGDGATYTLNIAPNTGDATGITGHVDIATDEGKHHLANKTAITLEQVTPFKVDVVTGKNVIPPYELAFPLPVLKDNCKQRIARKSCYFELVAPISSPLQNSDLDKLYFPTVLCDSSGPPVTLNTPHLSLDTLPILSLEDKAHINFLNPLTVFMFSPRELEIRKRITSSSLAPSVRVNFKESLMSMIKLSAGIQGGEYGLFGLSLPETGVHIIIFVSAIRLDGASANIVLDAAVMALTDEVVRSHKLDEFFLILQTLEIVSMCLDQDELNLWKSILPALAERCRTWEHLPSCEYAAKKRIPLNIINGAPVLCSCGNGHFPENYLPIPDWDSAKAYATRVAISPVSASGFVEEIVDPTLTAGEASGQKKESCRACGRGEAKEGGKLLMCTRCKKLKYCSKECQKGDWKTHRMECEEAQGK